MKLTKTIVDNLPIPRTGYAICWDDALPSFGVRVTASGVKAFILQRRIHGKEKRLTIGRYGALTAEQARKEAQKLLGQIATGRDPVAERHTERVKAITLGQCLSDYLNVRKSLKPTTVADLRRAMKGFADWMDRPLAAITAEMVGRRHRELGSRSEARANIAMRYLRALFNFALAQYADGEGRPILADNPVKKLSQTRAWYRVERRQTVIKPHQLRPWAEAVGYLPNPTMRDYFMLVLLTGLRREEALSLRWPDVDLEGRTLTVRDPKNRRDHTLPLSDYLAALLARRKSGAASEQVFADPLGRRLSNLRYALDRVARTSGVPFTVHDLRRTFATIAESLDIPAYALKRLLNHATGADVTAGYLVVDVERLRRPMQAITDYVLKCAGLWEGAEVIELRQAMS